MALGMASTFASVVVLVHTSAQVLYASAQCEPVFIRLCLYFTGNDSVNFVHFTGHSHSEGVLQAALTVDRRTPVGSQGCRLGSKDVGVSVTRSLM